MAEAEDKAEISGVVRDLQRKPIAGALVLLMCDGEAVARETKTDADGRYTFGEQHAL